MWIFLLVSTAWAECFLNKSNPPSFECRYDKSEVGRVHNFESQMSTPLSWLKCVHDLAEQSLGNNLIKQKQALLTWGKKGDKRGKFVTHQGKAYFIPLEELFNAPQGTVKKCQIGGDTYYFTAQDKTITAMTASAFVDQGQKIDSVVPLLIASTDKDYMSSLTEAIKERVTQTHNKFVMKNDALMTLKDWDASGLSEIKALKQCQKKSEQAGLPELVKLIESELVKFENYAKVEKKKIDLKIKASPGTKTLSN